MRAVALNLLIRTNGAKDNLGEAATLERTIRDAANNFQRLLDNGDGQMSAIVNKSGNVILRHLWELFLKDALETGENYEGFALVVVVDYSEFDLAIALFDDGRLRDRGVMSNLRVLTTYKGPTFSGNGIGLMVGFLSGGSAEPSCFMRLEGVGEVGSSSALRFPSNRPMLVIYISSRSHCKCDILSSGMAVVVQSQYLQSKWSCLRRV